MTIERFFPNTSTLAYYDFLDQVININSLDLEKLKQHKKLSNFQKTTSVLPLCQHEYTHWLDSTSTIWGINFLNVLYKTYDIEDYREFINGNIDYLNLNKLILRMRSHHLHIKNHSTENTIPWAYRYEYKIIKETYVQPVVHFLNKDTHEVICSVPMSTLSILESSATAQELAMKTNLILELLKDGEKIVEMKLHEKEIIEQIYNPSLTEYCVAVHIVANSIQVEDILQVYSICSILSRFVLNFPSKYFEKISLSSSIEELDFLTIDNIHIYENTLKEKDISLLFFIIARKLKFEKIIKINDESIQEAIVNILKSFKINFNKEFKDTVQEEYNEYSSYFEKYNYPPIEYIITAGKNNFNSLGIFGKQLYDFHSLETPKALLGDNSEFPCFKNFIKTFSPLIQKKHLSKATHAVNETFKMTFNK